MLTALGVALILMPVIFGLFDRAPKGKAMIEGFKPFMTTSRLAGFQRDIAQINAGVEQSKNDVANYLNRTAADRDIDFSFSTNYPSFAAFAKEWDGINAHMTALLDTVQNNLENYDAVAALPSFSLFPWFFVVPGILVLGLVALTITWPHRWRAVRWFLIGIGVGLVAAPAVFQMFQRAPKGAQMMSAFQSIETTENVERIQGYFGSMANGQGAIRLELVPALERTGLTMAQINERFPAVASLDAHWVHILNDMTPMIGAMSDNVANYEALAALPPFSLFPYFFVFPGVLIAAIAVATKPAKTDDTTSYIRAARHHLSVSTHP